MGAPSWDYLVVTASNGRQAAAYADELALRMGLGFIPRVRKAMAVPDPGGSRIGSGGSTVWSLLKVLERELGNDGARALDSRAWIEALSKLRILIVHAGGDSRRLPAYGPCGKIFIPVPGASDRAPGPTILDRLLPIYLGLPPVREGRGQVVVTTGDVLLSFDPGAVRFADEGITGLGSLEPPELAADHGVFRAGKDGRVRSFFQKPSPAEQAAKGAVGSQGLSVLDIGVMSLDARSAVALIRLFRVGRDASGGLSWEGEMAEAVERSGLDFYREICCAMGTEASFEDYPAAVRRAGSTLGTGPLKRIFDRVSRIPFSLSVLPACGFLHFGTPRQLIRSGNALLSEASAGSKEGALLAMNNEVSGNGRIRGRNSWVEGCRVRAVLGLGGENAVTGADILSPLSLPRNAVLDVLEGRDRKGRKVRFVRCYAVDDILNKPKDEGALLAGLALGEWLEVLGASEDDVWDPGTLREEKHVWNGRFFPATKDPEGFRDWLWMLRPKTATPDKKRAWKAADRYSFAETAGLASHDAFHSRRYRNRALEIAEEGGRVFRQESGFSALELSFVFANLAGEERRVWMSEVLDDAFRRFGSEGAVPGMDRLELARALHTLGSAVSKRATEGDRGWTRTLAEVYGKMPAARRAWLASLGLGEREFGSAAAWAEAARNAAFETVGRTIVRSREKLPEYPRNALRSDEIVWGRAPVRLDLGGGWSDTPPYSLERGGCVINAAVNLNGQPPIHVYARVIREPEIRIGSIDHGARIVVRDLAGLLDYRRPESMFGLAKAALALSGFSPEAAVWPSGVRTLRDMLGLFGGGIELTTLAAIPSGSGLGTSSIMGAGLAAV
ncbi:MAG TPA: L-fucokinase, partial [Acidobacteriota bacterium]|nr:L-fucokinase [Acidobacteriota bacterium]